MGEGRVDAVRVDAGVGPGLRDRLGQDDRDDEAVDADDAGHDDGDDVLHHGGRVADAGVDEGDAGFPRPPRRAPVGQAGGGAATFINAIASGTSVGLKTITTQGGGTLEWKDTGSSDLRLTVTSSAGTNAGSAVITVMYAQAFNTAIQP